MKFKVYKRKIEQVLVERKLRMKLTRKSKYKRKSQ